jgi:hypothetical protein
MLKGHSLRVVGPEIHSSSALTVSKEASQGNDPTALAISISSAGIPLISDNCIKKISYNSISECKNNLGIELLARRARQLNLLEWADCELAGAEFSYKQHQLGQRIFGVVLRPVLWHLLQEQLPIAHQAHTLFELLVVVVHLTWVLPALLAQPTPEKAYINT